MSTILLVEDNPDNAAVYRVMMEYLGHQVVVAADGEEGVRLARERLPDLIIMDIAIPKMNGWDATRLLKADPRTASIPVLALTAYARPGDEALCREAGCDAYLAKPVGPHQVGERVRELLGRFEATPPPVSAD